MANTSWVVQAWIRVMSFGDIYASGTNVYHSRQFQFDAGVNFDLSSVLKGLSFHTMVAIDYATLYTTSFNNTYATFQPTWANFNGKDVIVGLNNNGTVDKKSGVQNISGSTDNQTIAFNAHFDYDRTFDGVHNVSAMLVANGYQQTFSGQYHKTSNANMGLQLSYNYDHKYYAGFSLATPWSAKLPSSNRLGFSPSATLGWRLSKEKFLENSFFDDLTLSASYTDLKTDLGIDNYYMYLGVYQMVVGGIGTEVLVTQQFSQSMVRTTTSITCIARNSLSLFMPRCLISL